MARRTYEAISTEMWLCVYERVHEVPRGFAKALNRGNSRSSYAEAAFLIQRELCKVPTGFPHGLGCPSFPTMTSNLKSHL